jgi:hypothetical protein
MGCISATGTDAAEATTAGCADATALGALDSLDLVSALIGLTLAGALLSHAKPTVLTNNNAKAR